MSSQNRKQTKKAKTHKNEDEHGLTKILLQRLIEKREAQKSKIKSSGKRNRKITFESKTDKFIRLLKRKPEFPNNPVVNLKSEKIKKKPSQQRDVTTENDIMTLSPETEEILENVIESLETQNVDGTNIVEDVLETLEADNLIDTNIDQPDSIDDYNEEDDFIDDFDLNDDDIDTLLYEYFEAKLNLIPGESAVDNDILIHTEDIAHRVHRPLQKHLKNWVKSHKSNEDKSDEDKSNEDKSNEDKSNDDLLENDESHKSNADDLLENDESHKSNADDLLENDELVDRIKARYLEGLKYYEESDDEDDRNDYNPRLKELVQTYCLSRRNRRKSCSDIQNLLRTYYLEGVMSGHKYYEESDDEDDFDRNDYNPRLKELVQTYCLSRRNRRKSCSDIQNLLRTYYLEGVMSGHKYYEESDDEDDFDRNDYNPRLKELVQTYCLTRQNRKSF